MGIMFQKITKEVMFTGMESNQSIVHISIADMVADKLREGIKNGTFKSNQKLIETELCKLMEVSRTPIRTAFNVLVEEGLLERVQGYGVVVANKDAEAGCYYEILEVLERVALERAIDNISDAELTELKNIQNELEEKWNGRKEFVIMESPEGDGFSALDMQFHSIIEKASKNPLIKEYIGILCERGGITGFMKNITESSISEHRIIIRAIEEKDAVLADLIMKRHFE